MPSLQVFRRRGKRHTKTVVVDGAYSSSTESRLSGEHDTDSTVEERDGAACGSIHIFAPRLVGPIEFLLEESLDLTEAIFQSRHRKNPDLYRHDTAISLANERLIEQIDPAPAANCSTHDEIVCRMHGRCGVVADCSVACPRHHNNSSSPPRVCTLG
jgi:hypothetical protein